MTGSTAQVLKQVNLQGTFVPQATIDPAGFMAATDQLTTQTKSEAFPGFGGTTNIVIPQVGIISGVVLNFTGSVTSTPGGGSVATTMRWPYDLFRRILFTANGQTNLINASGWELRAREFMSKGDLTDRGVSRGIGGASPGTTRYQGSLSLNTENWGIGQNVTAIANGSYTVDLSIFIPIAVDQVTMTGSIFAQTAATDLSIAIQWAQQADLFTLAGGGTSALTGTLSVTPIAYSIPSDGAGGILIPDLSVFHSLISTRVGPPQNGDNEIRILGQGQGKTLGRIFMRVWNGTTPAPLTMDSSNFGQIAWRYGLNDTPRVYPSGKALAYANERLYACDLGSLQGFGCIDFMHENALRDMVDLTTATEARLVVNIASGVTLTAGAATEYCQELLFMGASAA